MLWGSPTLFISWLRENVLAPVWAVCFFVSSIRTPRFVRLLTYESNFRLKMRKLAKYPRKTWKGTIHSAGTHGGQPLSVPRLLRRLRARGGGGDRLVEAPRLGGGGRELGEAVGRLGGWEVRAISQGQNQMMLFLVRVAAVACWMWWCNLTANKTQKTQHSGGALSCKINSTCPQVSINQGVGGHEE